MSLRVLASRERQRNIERRSFSSLYEAWAQRFRLTVQNMMRPLALPLAGGMFSAVALFSMWVVPTYPVRSHQGHIGGVDVPTMLTTDATFKKASTVALFKNEVVLEVEVDSAGRTIDYQIVQGEEILNDPQMRRSIENFLVFAEFDPATTFGKPRRGKVRLYLNSSPSRIDVKG